MLHVSAGNALSCALPLGDSQSKKSRTRREITNFFEARRLQFNALELEGVQPKLHPAIYHSFTIARWIGGLALSTQRAVAIYALAAAIGACC